MYKYPGALAPQVPMSAQAWLRKADMAETSARFSQQTFAMGINLCLTVDKYSLAIEVPGGIRQPNTMLQNTSPAKT